MSHHSCFVPFLHCAVLLAQNFQILHHKYIVFLLAIQHTCGIFGVCHHQDVSVYHKLSTYLMYGLH